MDIILESALNEISQKIENTIPLDEQEADTLRKYPQLVDKLRKNYPEQMAKIDFGIPIFLYKMTADYIDNYVSFNADIVGNDSGMVRIKTGSYKCSYCEYTQKFLVSDDEVPLLCPQCKRRALKLNLKESDLVNFSILFVRELPENVDTQDIDEYQAFMATNWTVNYWELPPVALKVRISGYVRSRKKTKNDEFRLEFDADTIKPLEDIKSGKLSIELTDPTTGYSKAALIRRWCKEGMARMKAKP
jgi:DNA replicative helicase MCM subunit Mcm2 (Cdc46/Mcm family)